MIRPVLEWPHGNVWRSVADRITIASMNGLSVKLPAELHAMLSKEARRRNVQPVVPGAGTDRERAARQKRCVAAELRGSCR